MSDYSDKELAAIARRVKRLLRSAGGKPRAGWKVRVSDHGATLVVHYVDAAGLEDMWNTAL